MAARRLDPEGATGLVLLNEDGQFTQEVRLPRAWLLVRGLGARRVTGTLVPPPLEDLGQGYKVAYFSAGGGDLVEEHLATHVDPMLVMGVGDLDFDGDVDLVVAHGRAFFMAGRAGRSIGLSILRNRGGGDLEEIVWQPDVEVLGGVTLADVNGDGLEDVVFTDATVYDPAVVVAVGRRGELPEVEGRYALPDGEGGPVLAGDVNGDGRTDLVVLEQAAYEGSGVRVLLNRGNATAVVADREAAVVPTGFRLGASFPNPFNPQVRIPLEVPEGAGPVELRVYDILGQSVRRLVEGRLQAGSHLVPWDGRDESGATVAPGVYLLRLEVEGHVHVGKMARVE